MGRNSGGDTSVTDLFYSGSLTPTSSKHAKNIEGDIPDPLKLVCDIGKTATKRFRYKPEFSTKQDMHHGFIAEDVEAVNDEFVTQDMDGNKAIRLSDMVAPLYPAMAALCDQVEALQQELESLKKK